MNTASTHVTRRAFLGGAVVFGAAALCVPKPAYAEPTSADVQAQADAARVKLDDMLGKLEEASNNYHTALAEYDAAIEARDAAQAKIDENNVEIAKLQGRLGIRVNDMYRSGSSTFLDLLLGATSFESFVQNWDFLQKMNQSDADLVANTKSLREDNEIQKAQYNEQAKIAEEKTAEAKAIQKEAETLVVQYQAEVDTLDAEVAELVEQERRATAEAKAEEERRKFEEEQRTQQEVSNQSNSDFNGNSSGGATDTTSSESVGGYIPPSGSVVDYAVSQLGVPYAWGGTTPGVGLDCSGLTSWCWKSATGKWIGRTTWDQYANAAWIGSVGEAEPGDVLYNGGHVGICVESGGGRYIHAPQPGEVVCYSTWSQFYCSLRF